MDQSVVTVNDKLDIIKQLVRGLYDNYFIDNKEVVSYLANITNVSGNEFDSTSKYILNMVIPYQSVGDDREYLFINNNGNKKPKYERYFKTLNTISIIATTLHYICNLSSNNKEWENIVKIKTINISNSSDGSSISIYEPYDTRNTNALFKYKIVTDTLNIYLVNADNIISVSNVDTLQQYNNTDILTDIDVVKNYIGFMFKIKKHNLKKQITAFYYYLEILKVCFEFYTTAESLIALRNTGNICYRFSATDAANSEQQIFSSKMNLVMPLYKLNDNLDILLANSTTELGYPQYTLTGILGNTCPLTINFSPSRYYASNNSNYYHDVQLSPDDFQVKIASLDNHSLLENTVKKLYDIDEIDYQNVSISSNLIQQIVLKASGKVKSDGSSPCIVDGAYEIIAELNGDGGKKYNMNNCNITINLVKRSTDNLKRDYFEIGNKLQELNTDIEKSKDKINVQVRNYDVYNNILKALDMRRNIYYVIFGIIATAVLVLLLLDLQQSAKMYISLTIALVMLGINVVNYYMKYDYIEQFSTADMTISGTVRQVDDCTQIDVSTNFNTRVEFINKKIPNLTNEIVEILRKLNLFLSRLEFLDMNSKLSKSLKNEQRNFEEQATKYKYKEDANKKSIDIMKQEMIKKTGYINLISITIFIFVLVYILYLIDPTFLNVYMGIAVVLTLINLTVYYIIILHPVRTKAMNKYWVKPSTSVLQSVS